MPARLPRRPSLPRSARALVAVAGVVTLVASCTALSLLAAGASGGPARSAAEQQRVKQGATARRSLSRAAERAPRARKGRCSRTAVVPGQGPSCRTSDGMYVVPQSDGAPLVTHGPDVVSSTARSGPSGGFGTPSSIACAPTSRTRHVVLAYLLPSDYASGSSRVHGDRHATVADQMRQALYDASAVVDARAGELAPGQRRRIRVACDDDGRPTVLRVVLPRTATQYLAPGAGFGMLGDDLRQLGHLPQYARFAARRLPSVRRVLSYYDADFHSGYAGQGTMFRRSTLMRDSGVSASSPLVSRTIRNINNNPPSASFAVQYGTRDYLGVPDPPMYTSLLHELSHTMGAVQDEPPTASDAGHCVDGLDLMCYEDTPGSRYRETACPDPAPPIGPEDELFDCNGDTYFHPSPPAGHPLAASSTWHLGLPANQTFATTGAAAPAAVSTVRVFGTGTRRTVRWPAVADAAGYELAWRRVGRPWQHMYVTRPVAQPMLAPRTRYEFAVGAVTRGLVMGPRASTAARTGIDTTPPTAPTLLRTMSTSRSSARLRVRLATDNVRVVRYRVERRSGARWVRHATLRAPAPRATPVVVGVGALPSGTRNVLRLRALDARGNVSTPSRAVVATTRR